MRIRWSEKEVAVQFGQEDDIWEEVIPTPCGLAQVGSGKAWKGGPPAADVGISGKVDLFVWYYVMYFEKQQE